MTEVKQEAGSAAPVKDEAVKAEAGAAEANAPTEDVKVDERVFRQIEFYFSDSNLPKDKFLLKETKSNEEGWVSLQLISTFKKMRDYGATVEGLAAAARTSEFLAVDDEGKRVRRTTDLPDSDVTLERSISAKTFPLEATIEEVQAFFEPHGKILSVRLFKTGGDKKENKAATFNGTVFVEFSSKEEAEAVVTKELEYKGEKLTMTAKTAFLETLKGQRKGGDDKKKGKDHKGKDQKAGGKRKREDEDGGDDGEKKAKGNDGEAVEEKKEYISYPKGVFVKLAGVGSEATMPNIKDHYTKYGNVKFVEFKDGETDACIRFETPEEATEAVKCEQGAETDLGGAVPAVSLLTGEEEDAKLEDIKQRQVRSSPARAPCAAVRTRGARCCALLLQDGPAAPSDARNLMIGRV